MNIRQAADFAGISTKTARYYCDIGLTPVGRGQNGYRLYSQKDATELRFVVRARAAGFSLSECRQLLTFQQNRNRASADVKALALAHIEKIETKIQNLNKIHEHLMKIATACPGDKKPDCPILNIFAD